MVNPTPETLTLVDRGSRLTNGATVLESSSIYPPDEGGGFVAHGVVLCVTANGHYATWSCRLHDLSASSGEYFNDLDEAIESYVQRCKLRGLNHFLHR